MHTKSATDELILRGDERNGLDQDITHSRPLDVHTWSEHPEVNEFVDLIWERYFRSVLDPDTGRQGRRARTHPKNQLKVLLLDVYVAWFNDPTMCIGAAMSPNAYLVESRYNAIHISRGIIRLIQRAHEVGLIGLWRGSEWRGMTSRIWPTESLVELFRQARFGVLDIGTFPERECILLSRAKAAWADPESEEDEGARRPRTRFIEYDDTDDTNRMRDILRRHNALLHQTFIDIPTLDRPIVTWGADGGGRPTQVVLDQRHKFVRRIFYRESWNLGGRYHGGFWQQLSKEWRKELWINDRPTVEDDYSGFHIGLLCALEGVTMAPHPYVLDDLTIAEDRETQKEWVKSLVLMALNARTTSAAFSAFRSDQPSGSPAKRFTNAELMVILEAFKRKHPAIAQYVCADVGVKLMAIDGRITTRLIDHFTQRSIPVLTIHDSYVVDINHALEMRREMLKAVQAELPAAVINIERLGLEQDEVRRIKGVGRYRNQGRLSHLRSQHSEGYLYRKRQFEQWIGRRM